MHTELVPEATTYMWGSIIIIIVPIMNRWVREICKLSKLICIWTDQSRCRYLADDTCAGTYIRLHFRNFYSHKKAANPQYAHDSTDGESYRAESLLETPSRGRFPTIHYPITAPVDFHGPLSKIERFACLTVELPACPLLLCAPRGT